MSRYIKLGIGVLLVVATTLLVGFFIATNDIALLNPKGLVGEKQLKLMAIAVALCLIVIIPVFALTFHIAWKYREGNTKATYRPNWDHHHLLESIWWGIPIVIIAALSVITWQSSHALDPYRALDSDVKPLRVQVIALQWKWLFVYPDQRVASVNYLNVPVDTPINFEITSDAPMNSFWVPKLGSQVYAMAGMTTKLHLIANETGTYPGVSANISGEGFADMKFNVHAISRADFDAWSKKLQNTGENLSQNTYDILAKPSVPKDFPSYALRDEGLFERAVMKYMVPAENLEAHNHEVSDHEH